MPCAAEHDMAGTWQDGLHDAQTSEPLVMETIFNKFRQHQVHTWKFYSNVNQQSNQGMVDLIQLGLCI